MEHIISIFFDVFCWVFWILVILSFFLRDVPFFRSIWNFFVLLMGVLLLVLAGNYVKKEVKDWWNK
jgi:uncharacterized protein YhhL (DUF1145 family)